MKPAKKIEIIIESIQLPKLVRIMNELAMPGYSIIHNVTGHGTHGDHEAEDQLSEVLTNSYITVICSEIQAKQLTKRIKPKLAKWGGICFMSGVEVLQLT